MKKSAFSTILMIIGLVMFSGCASMHVWPDQERSAESKMVVIEGNIGDGLKTGSITPDQAQMFLTTLKGIRIDYLELRNKAVYQKEWDSLHHRLSMLGEEINRAMNRPTRMETPIHMDRISILQRNIDDGRISGRLPIREEREFQARLDSIRRDSQQMTEGSRPVRHDGRADISHRLDSLARDLERFR